MKIDYQKLDARVMELKDELIADIQAWVAVPSVQSAPLPGMPYGENNARMLALALDTARRYGFETRNVDNYAGDITMGSGEQTLGILAHLDVVPAGEGWKHEPFGGEIDNGRIYGRGTIDDKGPALCALYAMRAVRDCGVPMKDSVRLILGCDEETGMSDMRYYASKHKMPDYGFSPDACFPLINIEKGGVNVELIYAADGENGAEIPVYELYAGERPNVVPAHAYAVVGADRAGIAFIQAKIGEIAREMNQKLSVRDLGDGRAEISAEGVLSHGSLPEQGVNAAGILMLALDKLGAGKAVLPALKMMNEKIGMEPDGESLGIKCSDELSHNLSCNLGILRWNGHDFSATLDIRYPLCTNETEILGRITMAVSPYGASVRMLSAHTPLHVPAEHKVVRGLLKVYNEVTGQNASPIAIGGGTYSRMMPNTVAFGMVFPDEEDMCHVADENVAIDRMMDAVKIYARAIAELGSGSIA